MRFDALLRAHAFMKVERPSEVWEADTEDFRFVPLLGEMIAAASGGGAELDQLTLNVSNVVVEAPENGEDSAGSTDPGDYVAVTVSGRTDLGGDGTWHPGRRSESALLNRLHERLLVAGAVFAYVRRMPPNGSLTVFLPRLNKQSHSE